MSIKAAVARFVPVVEILRLMDRRSKSKLVALTVSSVITGLLQAAVLVGIVQLGVALADTSGDVTGQIGPFGSFDFSVGQLLAASLGATVVVMLLDLLNAHVAASLAAGVGLRVRRDFIDSYVHTSWPEHTRLRDGELHELGVVAPNHATVMVQAMATGMIAVGNFSAMLFVAFAVNAAASAGVVAVVLFLLLLMQPMARFQQRMTKRTQRLNITYGGRLIDTQSMSQEIAVYGVRDEIQAELDRDNVDLSRVRYRMNLMQRLSSAMFRHVGLIFVLAVIAIAYSLQVSELGSLGAVFLILLRALGYGQVAQTAQHRLRAEQPWPIVVRDAISRFDRSRPKSGSRSVDTLQRLAFDDVTFSYGDIEVLRHVSFEVQAGEVVGIVGPSGAGKSTLVQLLLRLRLQDSGSFLLDGTPVEEIDLDSFYRRVAFVSQSPQTIRGSFEDNIRFHRNWVDAGMVAEAVRGANLTADVEGMEKGLETFVGERGGNISGGQRQRLALARALAGHPDLLILDEPTSALDPTSEAMIKETIEALKGQVTMFIVAHRFSTLGVCDRIMVIEEGRVTGFDTPESLLATNGFFSRASATQQL